MGASFRVGRLFEPPHLFDNAVFRVGAYSSGRLNEGGA